MERVWAAVAPHVVDRSLSIIILECSYSDDRPDSLLFGHLKPEYFIQELSVLAGHVQEALAKDDIDGVVGDDDYYLTLMRRLKIIVSHIKPESLLYSSSSSFSSSSSPSSSSSSLSTREIVRLELERWNDESGLLLDLQFMEPGERLGYSSGGGGGGRGGGGRGLKWSRLSLSFGLLISIWAIVFVVA